MIFVLDGIRYDSLSLHQVDTRRPSQPLYLATPDHALVFTVTVTRWEGVTVRRATPAESQDFHTLARFAPALPLKRPA